MSNVPFRQPAAGSATDRTNPIGAPSDDMRAWWAGIVEANIEAAYRFVRAHAPAEQADDLVQEVFVAAAQNAWQFDPTKGSVWHWLRGIARLKIAGHYRQAAGRSALQEALTWAEGDGQAVRAVIDERPMPDEICERAEFRALARAALSTLEPDHQTCLIACYYESLSLEEIGRRMKRSRSAVNSLLHRARQELRQAFVRLTSEKAPCKENES